MKGFAASGREILWLGQEKALLTANRYWEHRNERGQGVPESGNLRLMLRVEFLEKFWCPTILSSDLL
jgi:hypothetical protein